MFKQMETYAFLETEISTDKSERQGYPEPESEESKKGGEWNSTRAVLGPHNDVHDKEQSENNAAIANHLKFKQVKTERMDK